ncbi:MAG: helix-turn-helix transcriptional regulator [Candidatus Eremiobacteraeota bacterium]|nr:helix-turn-helix transcriptional regulator [Candidatus Eremiobacteraeota bacterium]
MGERLWICRPDQQIRFRVRQSSSDRGWRGFEAFHYDASDGYSETFFTEHSISMHVGQPVLVRSECDGVELHRLQVPGDIKVVPAGFSRVWEIAAPTNKLVVDIAPWFVHATAEEMGINAVTVVPQLHLTDKRMEHICWALLQELESPDPLGRLYAESLGLALVAQLIRSSTPTAPRRACGLPKRRLQRVVDYVHEHLSEQLSLHELANIADLSPSHFKAQFRQSTGMPVHQYVIAARVREALDLLVRTSLPVLEVALRAGFANQSHLSRHLRRSYGIAPAAIRREAH